MRTPVTRMRLPSRRAMGLRLPRQTGCYGGRRTPCHRDRAATVSPMRIGILGGTGPAGSALAARLASVGFETVIGSRSRYRALEVVDGLKAQWAGPRAHHRRRRQRGRRRRRPRRDRHPVGRRHPDRPAGRRPPAGQGRDLDGQRPHADRQGVPAARAARGVGGRERPGGAARGAWWRPASTTCPPRSWATSTTRSRATCSSAPTTPRPPRPPPTWWPRSRNMRPLDCGELSLATPIESFTAVLLQLNVRYKTRVAVKFTSIPE